MRLKRLALIAAFEFHLAALNPWIVAFAGALALLSLALSYFGLVIAGYGHVVGFARTTASLLNLVLLLVPLASLVVGVGIFSQERGALDTLLSQPVNRFEIFFGKYLGLLGALLAALFCGLGAAGIVIALRAGPAEWKQYLVLVGLSAYLTMVFVGLAAVIAVLIRERTHALGAAILLWLGLLLVYDLISLGIAVLFAGNWIRPYLMTLLLANPVDLVRMLVLIALGARASLGPGGFGIAPLQCANIAIQRSLWQKSLFKSSFRSGPAEGSRLGWA